jgi:hypothetical protein
MLGPLQHRLGRPCLDDSPALHHGHPVGDLLDDTQVVGDEQVRQAELALDLFKKVEDLRLHADVEGRGRLVAGDGDALA